jgi:hypothetical protein
MKYEFSEFNEVNLRKIYSEFGLRAAEIGELVGITESAVLWRLKNLGIPTNPKTIKRSDVEVVFNGRRRSEKEGLTPDLLKVLYEQHLSDIEIGMMFGMTGEGVAYRRKKLGIATQTLTIRRVNKNHSQGLKDIQELTKEELENELLNIGIKGIAKKYNTTFLTVKSIMQDRGCCSQRYWFSCW